jgi:hypothetical protein
MLKGQARSLSLPSILLLYHMVSLVALPTIVFVLTNPDGTFIAYIKAARGYDDTFIAIMRVRPPPPLFLPSYS